jgi:tRNA(Ile2)-agmatinylcytidine synthase
MRRFLNVAGDRDRAFAIACGTVEELADFSCENTNPGIVVVDNQPDPAFYIKAVTDFCEIDEAIAVLDTAGAQYRGYKNRRGLIGATAAVASELDDRTSEILVYRQPDRWGTPRVVDRQSLFDAEEETFPHTWDTVDTANDVVVCVPHTPDPGFLVSAARSDMGDEARQMINRKSRLNRFGSRTRN